FSVQADGRQIDLDRLDDTQQSQAGSDSPALERRLAAVRSVIERIPVPTGKGEINVALPAVVAGDTYIRDVVARVRPFGKGWDLRTFRATFPGNTLLEAQGRIGLREDFGFAGKMLLASRQPSGFASWLTGDVSPQIRNLRAVGLDATATISPRQATFENLELRLDDAVLGGKLQWLVGSGDKPAIIAELSGNRVNTEDLRALYSIARGQSGDDLVSHDLNITLNAGRLESRVLDVDVEAENVAGQIQVRDGSMSIERFSAANLYGASVASEGRIENILSSPNGNMKVSLRAENGNGFLTFVEALTGPNALLDPLLADASLTQAMSLDIELDSTSRDGGVKGVLVAVGTIAGTRLAHRAGFEGEGSAFDTLAFDLDLSLENDEPQRLMRQTGIETLPDLISETVPGPLKLSTSATGSLREGFQSRLLASAPGTDVSASGKLVFKGWGLDEASLDTRFGSADLMPWLRVSGVSLPLEVSRELPASGSFKAEKLGNDATFNAIEGQVAGNRISGDLAFKRDGLARPRLEGALNVDHMDILLFADTVFGRYGSLGLADGVLAGEDLSFGPAPYKGFDARLKLSAARADFGDILSGRNAASEFVMIDGAADINSIRFETLGGEISGSLNLGNTEGTVIAKGNFFLEGADATEVLEQAGLPDIATGAVQATGSFEGAGKSVAGLIANLSGNGFAKLERARVSGLAPDGLGGLLESADVEGFEVNAQSVADLTERHLLQGETDIGEVDAPYSITRGSLRFRNVGADLGNVRLTGDLEAELLTGNLESDFTATFIPDRRNAISGADPQITVSFTGPAQLLERTVDTGLLEGYLSLRAFEASQRRIETLEARVIENQRLLRIISFNRLREDHVLREEQERQAMEAVAETRR
ncbi:MAG: AsmA-like C-terminal region-containing protein, partial [Pseudomonadota bacterium]